MTTYTRHLPAPIPAGLAVTGFAFNRTRHLRDWARRQSVAAPSENAGGGVAANIAAPMPCAADADTGMPAGDAGLAPSRP